MLILTSILIYLTKVFVFIEVMQQNNFVSACLFQTTLTLYCTVLQIISWLNKTFIIKFFVCFILNNYVEKYILNCPCNQTYANSCESAIYCKDGYKKMLIYSANSSNSTKYRLLL